MVLEVERCGTTAEGTLGSSSSIAARRATRAVHRRRVLLLLAVAFVSTAAASACRSEAGGVEPSPASRGQVREPREHAQPSGTERAGSASEVPARGRLGGAPEPTSTAALGSSSRLVWDFPDGPLGELRVIVAVPPHDPESAPLPVLIALHGKGEALKGPLRGARGWLDDYELGKAMEALARGRLTSEDFRGLATAARLAEIRADLSSQAYRGMIVVMPYTPLALAGNKPFSAVLPYGRFLVESVLPRVYRETPAAHGSSSTGIDGVSLGGRVALLVGLSFPKSFGAVGTLQAAFDAAEAAELVELARSARLQNPGLKLRLLTSDGDFYLKPLRAISEAWRQARIEHELRIVMGPHDYSFNRGPGAIEMLLFHDRALRFGESVVPTAGKGP